MLILVYHTTFWKIFWTSKFNKNKFLFFLEKVTWYAFSEAYDNFSSDEIHACRFGMEYLQAKAT